MSYPFLTAPHDRLYSIYLASFVVIGVVLFFAARRKGAFTLRSLTGFLFPREIYLSRSSILDLKFYVIDRILRRVLQFAYLLSGFGVVAELTRVVLTAALGHGPVFSQGEHATALMILYSVTVFIAFDFGGYVAHYLSHKVPIFWEFHKVHHSAAVLTPLTVMRVHPVNFLVKSSVPSVTAGIVTGIFAYALAEEPKSSTYLVIGLLNVSVMTFATNLFANLRHSHLWLSFGPVLSHILSSPAQHQIHHSIEPRHVDRNLGNVLSVWDWMFGTLYVPHGKESFEIGLKDGEHQIYGDIATLYVLPFKKAAGLVAVSLARGRRGGLA